MLVVGVLVLLGALRQLGIIPGRAPASDPRSRAMVGTWAGSISNCRSAMTFNADGTYVVHTGAVARWHIEGDRLILTGDGSAMTWRLLAWTDDSLNFMLGDPGQRYTMVRCPGPAGAGSPSPGSQAPGTNASVSVAPPPGLQGRWGVSFLVDGVQYTGEFLGANGSGTLVLSYRDETGPMRVSEQCTYSGTTNMTVRCRDPQILSGRNTYSPDSFDLTPDGPGVMRGRIFSTNGDSTTTTFTRR